MENYEVNQNNIDPQELLNELKTDIMMFVKIAIRRAATIHSNSSHIKKVLKNELDESLNKFVISIKEQIDTRHNNIDQEIEFLEEEIIKFSNNNTGSFNIISMSEDIKSITKDYCDGVDSIYAIVNKTEDINDKVCAMKEQQSLALTSLESFAATTGKALSLYKKKEIKNIKKFNYACNEQQEQLKINIKKNKGLKKELLALYDNKKELNEYIIYKQKELNELKDVYNNLEEKIDKEKEQFMMYKKSIINAKNTISNIENSISEKEKLLKRLNSELNLESISELSSDINTTNIREMENFMDSNYIHFYNGNSNNFFIYNLQIKKLFKHKLKKSVPMNYDSIQVGFKVFITGGFDTEKIEFFKGNLQIECKMDYSIEESFKKDMIYPKCQHKLVALDRNLIYCLGGKNKNERYMNTCEIYDIDEDKWINGVPMLTYKLLPSAVSFNCSFIYVFGGYNTALLKTIEVLDVKRNCWQYIKFELIDWTAKSELGIIQISYNEILIFGGTYIGKASNNESFIFEPDRKKITKLKSCLKDKDWFTMQAPVRYEKKIYAFGKYKSGLHVFDINEKTWSSIDVIKT